MSIAVVQNLYRVFKPYQLSESFSGCNHCVNAAWSERLASIPLRDLTIQDLDLYAFKAMTTWGDVTDFKYFLPRLFELALPNLSSVNDPETLLGKLAYAHWDSWPSLEQQAVNDFLDELWKTTLSRPLSRDEDESSDTLLCAIGNARATMQRFLDGWLTANSDSAIMHLAEFINRNAPALRDRGHLWKSYWTNCSAEANAVASWVKGIRIRDRLQSARASHSDRIENALWEHATICSDSAK